MTLIQEATAIMERMPRKSQQVVVDLLRMMSRDLPPRSEEEEKPASFKRTGKARFDLPADFDEHFDDANEEIASMFYGEGI